MSTNKTNKRRDELNKVSGGFSFNGNANGRIDLKVDSSKFDNSAISNTRPNKYQETQKDYVYVL